jgi:sporulation protein YlmC with PRC-barrel domain
MNQLQTFSNSPIKASSIIGTDVVNPNGDNLGDVKEVVIDPRTGRVAYAVVSFGGFLSMGEKLFAIPFSALEYHVADNNYVLNVSKEKLEAAPGFDPDNWPAMSNEQWNRDVYKYYERSPYWE